jgi:hypothetical protein
MSKKVKPLADLISISLVAICSSHREINESSIYTELEHLGLNLNHEELNELTAHIAAIRSGFQAAK